MVRQDYAFPFRIDLASRQAAQSSGYDLHVEQMVRQVLLTSPGERADLPDFGCGLRRLLFGPNTPSLAATAQVLIQQALHRWLSSHIDVQKVEVVAPDGPVDEAQLLVRIEYLLRETLTKKSLEVLVK